MRRLAWLAAVAAALAGYLWLYERGRPSPEATRAEARRLLPGFDRGAVARIAVRRPAGDYRLVRGAGDGGAWTVETGPMGANGPGGPAPSSPGAVAELLAALDNAEIDRRLADGAAAAGLSPPAAELDIEGAGDRRWRVALGAADGSGRGVFVRPVGAPEILVVGRHLADVVDRPAIAFRERRLLPDPTLLLRVRRLEWQLDGDRREIALVGGLWRDGHGLRIPRDAVEAAAGTLAAREATQFLPPAAAAPTVAAAPRATTAPTVPPPAASVSTAPSAVTASAGVTEAARLTVSLSAPPDTLLTLSVAAAPAPRSICAPAADRAAAPHAAAPDAATPDAAKPEAGYPAERRLAARAPSVDAGGADASERLCLAAADVDAIIRALTLASRRDLALLATRPEEMERITVTEGAQRLVLVRDARLGWRLEEPRVPWEIDRDELSAWLDRLASARLLVDGAPLPSVPPARERADAILVVESAGGAREELRLFPAATGARARLLAHRADEAAPATVATTLRAELTADPLRLRDRRPLRLARYDLQRIRVAEAHGGRPPLVLAKDAAEAWRALAPAAPVDDAALEAFLAAATDLRADRFLPPGTAVAPSRTIDLVERRGDAFTTHRLELGGVAAGGCAARLPTGAPAAVMALPAATCRALLAPLTRAPERPGR